MSGEKRRVREVLTYGCPFGPKEWYDHPRRATYLTCLPRGNWGFCELDGRQNEQSLKRVRRVPSSWSGGEGVRLGCHGSGSVNKPYWANGRKCRSARIYMRIASASWRVGLGS
jgi:hypothetical protein